MPTTSSITHPGEIRTEALHPNDFDRWNELVTRSPHGTIFHHSWWLEATGCNFKIIVCLKEPGELLAGIPLPWKKRKGITLFHSPLLTPYLGPIFDLSRARDPVGQLSLMRRAGEMLGRAIEGADSLSYDVGPEGPDLQGFLWADFRAELAYTFRFEAGTPAEEILRRMAPTHRNELSKAERHQVTVEAGENMDAFLELNRKTFARQGMPYPYSEPQLRDLWSAARSRGRARIYLANTGEGRYGAGLLIVWDSRTSYQLMAGGDPEIRSLGCGNLAEWHAIRDSLSAGLAYDFEGSHLHGVEQHYRDWGATPRPFWRLEKALTLKGAVARVLARRRNYQRWL